MNPATSTQQDSGKFGSKPNYLSAMLSISLILFILGIFGFILINTRQLISFYKENLNLIIEMVMPCLFRVETVFHIGGHGLFLEYALRRAVRSPLGRVQKVHTISLSEVKLFPTKVKRIVSTHCLRVVVPVRMFDNITQAGRGGRKRGACALGLHFNGQND